MPNVRNSVTLPAVVKRVYPLAICKYNATLYTIVFDTCIHVQVEQSVNYWFSDEGSEDWFLIIALLFARLLSDVGHSQVQCDIKVKTSLDQSRFNTINTAYL